MANYGNISSEIKLINSLNFYQRSLGELSLTLTPEEKTAIKNLAEKFFKRALLLFNCLAVFISKQQKTKFWK